jgi:hypothetical protein
LTCKLASQSLQGAAKVATLPLENGGGGSGSGPGFLRSNLQFSTSIPFSPPVYSNLEILASHPVWPKEHWNAP